MNEEEQTVYLEILLKKLAELQEDKHQIQKHYFAAVSDSYDERLHEHALNSIEKSERNLYEQIGREHVKGLHEREGEAP